MVQPVTSSHAGRHRTERRIALLGFAILCISFFLPYPAVYPVSIRHYDNPASGTMTTFYINVMAPRTQQNSGMSPAYLVIGEGHALHYFSGRGSPFLFGFVGFCLLAISLIRRPRADDRSFAAVMQAGWGVGLIFLAFVVCLALIRAGDMAIHAVCGGTWADPHDLVEALASFWPMFAIFFAVIFAMGFGFAAMLLTRKELRAPLGLLICGVVSLLILSVQVSQVTQTEDIGPILALLGGILVVIGALAEVISILRGR